MSLSYSLSKRSLGVLNSALDIHLDNVSTIYDVVQSYIDGSDHNFDILVYYSFLYNSLEDGKFVFSIPFNGKDFDMKRSSLFNVPDSFGEIDHDYEVAISNGYEFKIFLHSEVRVKFVIDI